MIRVNGRLYGTAPQLAAALGPDITPAMIRRWRERDGLTTIRAGHNTYSPLDEATTIEAAKYLSGRGRPRRLDEAAVAAA